uniref:Transglutaminase N-terminal domain-containing protein n=1 Tax=Acanthochromis polyacanthus TaxID=80966 RepID=A0A3Q1HG32_9TELE
MGNFLRLKRRDAMEGNRRTQVQTHIREKWVEHHTNEVSQQRLVVRRGQNFKMTLTLTQPFNPEFQQLVLTAKTGHRSVCYSPSRCPCGGVRTVRETSGGGKVTGKASGALQPLVLR